MALEDDVVKKAKDKMRAKAKKPRSQKMQYIFWVGGSVASIFGAVIVLVLNPDRGPFQIPVNDANLISHVNKNAKTWQAGASSFFEDWTIGDANMLEGVYGSAVAGPMTQCQVPEVNVPDNFDARQKWDKCFQSPIYSMGNCTASWAIATATSLSNRFCVSNPDQYSDLMLSPQQLLSCDTMQRGCNGGDLDTAWKYVEREGLVSEACFPYQADSTVACSQKCHSDAPMKAATHCLLNGALMIKREVLTNGPVVAPVFLMSDFLVYKGGLYQEMHTAAPLVDSRRNRIIHAVKVVGWGKAHGKSYWLIENSWGEDWGEGGYAKVFTGGDPEKPEGILIESYAVAGIPMSPKVDEGADGEDGDLEEDGDLGDIDADLDDPEQPKAKGGDDMHDPDFEEDG